MTALRRKSEVIDAVQWARVSDDFPVKISWYPAPYDGPPTTRCGRCGSYTNDHGWCNRLGKSICPGDWFILGSDGEYRLKRRADFTSREWEPIPERDEEAEAKLVEDVERELAAASSFGVGQLMAQRIIARVRGEETTP